MTERYRPPGLEHASDAYEALIDRCMHVLSGAEFKAVLYSARRTIGFGKARDGISLNQFCNGIVTRDGRRLDHGTGLTRTVAHQAMCKLEQRGLVRRHIRPNPQATEYEIVWSAVQDFEKHTSPKNRLVRKVDQFKKRTGTSPKNRPELVRKTDSQSSVQPPVQPSEPDCDSANRSDDDENLPPVERLTRWIQTHHPEANAADVVGFIRSDLADRNLEVTPAFVQFIRENATGKAHNPAGLYRKLVKQFMTKLRSVGAEQRMAVRRAVTTGIQSDGFDGAAKYPCCNGTGRNAAGGYCDNCGVGDTLRKLDARKAKASNGTGLQNAAAVIAEVDVPKCSGEAAASAEETADQRGTGAKCSDSSGGS